MATKWIIGLDLGRTGNGALEFAKWFAGAGGAVGVHVLEEEHLRYVLRTHHLDEVTQGAEAALRARIAAAGAASTVSALRVVQAVQADDALEAERSAAGAAGVILGRAAETGGLHVVRLGRVVRRILRALPSPVVVVPPDFAAPGDGPVIAMTNLHEDAAAGCRFAADAARRLGRRWLALHVSRGLDAEYLPGDTQARARGEHRAAARAALDAWLREHGLQPDGVVAEEGSAIVKACEVAVRERAPLVVTGSRRLSTAERAIQASFGSALAAAAPVPVAVVPPAR